MTTALWIAALTPLAVAVLGFAGWFTRRTWGVVRGLGHFLDDYKGRPAHDGTAATPGFMARLASVEESLAHVVAETRPNHGNSLRDVVARTAADVADIKHEQAGVRTRLELLQAQHPPIQPGGAP
jgi:hypothetical protein